MGSGYPVVGIVPVRPRSTLSLKTPPLASIYLPWDDMPHGEFDSIQIKHSTNPAGRLGIINFRPSCASCIRLNPNSVADEPGKAGPIDERETPALRLVTPEINHLVVMRRFRC